MSISLEIIRKPLIRNATHKIRSGWNCSSYNELYHSWVVVVVGGGGGIGVVCEGYYKPSTVGCKIKKSLNAGYLQL